MLYRSTVNLPGCPVGHTAEFPATPRTAVLVRQGFLMPMGGVRSLVEPFTQESLWSNPQPQVEVEGSPIEVIEPQPPVEEEAKPVKKAAKKSQGGRGGH